MKDKLIQQEKVIVAVMSDHEEKLNDKNKCMKLREESSDMERNNFEKQFSDLAMSMELKLNDGEKQPK
ncbi:hypothetical protein F2Q70_00003104 [Brassica cretica]|uniref:Uncharacterized protein n=1 Tax=Brassica cretica TaxID=69181 RepID=A0A8S9FTC7_BRACR|nr:hypothetical protein F2Q68_00020744 [Brassica cretica]KAF2570890.1 hypothetical protein F2Q70_00003104 [Brassica cretica]